MRLNRIADKSKSGKFLKSTKFCIPNTNDIGSTNMKSTSTHDKTKVVLERHYISLI